MLPKFLEDAIEKNTTSLGTHPALPPDEEESFVGYIVRKRYNEVMGDMTCEDVTEVARTLNRLVTECTKIEEPIKEALENLCSNLCAKIFKIPEDTITIRGKIVTSCDMTKYRMTPEPVSDFTFNDIDDMKQLSDEVYKRRMVDALISGASIYYATNIELYIQEVYKLNPQLVNLYQEIIKYNNILLFNQKDTINSVLKSNSGKVDVNIGEEDERIVVDAEGTIFPVLLEYVIHGLLEVASLHGLPKDRKRAEYIMAKADYRLAENWDMRLGVPLWNILVEELEEGGHDITEVGANFMIMEISRLKPEVFNTYLQNAFKKTNKGIKMTNELADTIEYNKEVDDFNNFVQVNNEKYPINDNSEYSSDELKILSEDCFTPDELMEQSLDVE
jgi:hypothetical protein